MIHEGTPPSYHAGHLSSSSRSRTGLGVRFCRAVNPKTPGTIAKRPKLIWFCADGLWTLQWRAANSKVSCGREGLLPVHVHICPWALEGQRVAHAECQSCSPCSRRYVPVCPRQASLWTVPPDHIPSTQQISGVSNHSRIVF